MYKYIRILPKEPEEYLLDPEIEPVPQKQNSRIRFIYATSLSDDIVIFLF